MNIPHAEVKRRNDRVIVMYIRGYTRKQLAYRFKISYDSVKKIIYMIDRRRTPR